jgi:flagellin
VYKSGTFQISRIEILTRVASETAHVSQKEINMGMRVGTNITALKTQQALGITKRSMELAMGKLSSGSRINRASDDAVGLAISENLKAQIRGLSQANRNAQDGISMIQISEGGLNEISNMLVRLRELGIQAASDTIGPSERKMVNLEYQEVLSEVDRIAGTTEFNGSKLLSGEGERIDFQINTRNSDTLDRVSYDPAQSDATTTGLGIGWNTVETKEQAQESLDTIDQAIAQVNSLRSSMGAMQSRLNSSVENLFSSIENISVANSRIRDADVAAESSEFAKQNVLMQSGTAILAQANQQNGLALSLLGKN